MIDVSGDGPNNEGHLVDKVRDEIVAKGIVINGLPIMTPADQFDVYYLADLDKYYAGCVIGGTGAFIQVAHGFEDLARALRRKLILEISDAGPSENPLLVKVAAATPARRNRAPCGLRKGLRYRRADAFRRIWNGGGPPLQACRRTAQDSRHWIQWQALAIFLDQQGEIFVERIAQELMARHALFHRDKPQCLMLVG